MFIEKIEKETLLKPLQVVIGIVERKQTLTHIIECAD